MISATFLAIFFVPLFYVAVQRRFGGKRDRHAKEAHAVQEHATKG
jgi:hypothetical protein